MGALVNPRWLTALAGVLAAMIIALNVFLLAAGLLRLRRQRLGFRRWPSPTTSSEVLDSLPPDWTDLEVDLRIDDESRYVDTAVALSQVNAQPLLARPTGTGGCSSPTASATPPRRRR